MLSDIQASLFFPDSRITTPFGWDPDPRFGPRIHHAIDRAGPGLVVLPFDAERLEWVDHDAQGNSVLRAFAAGGALELRMLHFRPAERTPEIRTGFADGAPAGTPIAPAGDVGIGSGRHVHYQLMLAPGAFDAELDTLAPGWREDKSAEYRTTYGLPYIMELSARRVRWMSPLALRRLDPWTGKDRIIIDTAEILGL